MKWKICGMREIENCEDVAQFSPDFMGFIWVSASPRYVGNDYVIPKTLPNSIQKVGVFVNEAVEKIIDLSKKAGFTWVQLHGDESEQEILALQKKGLKVIKAISVANEQDIQSANGYCNLPDYFLFDTKKGSQVGGTGERFDWTILDAYKGNAPLILAGGLDLETIEDAIDLGKKYPIEVLDFNSKLEIKPGLKEVSKVVEISKKIKIK
ncbi:MAG: Phosphoribosylanthranilate isomerase [Bacteroidota bacterium]|jgi:phosphoribosylanthranilate isomerase